MKKAKPLTRAEKRAKNNYKGVSLSVRRNNNMTNLNTGPQSIGCGGSYGANSLGKANTNYLALVVQRSNGIWGYVRVNSHCLDVVSEPIVYDEDEADNLTEIWKRVVIDNAIPWEDSVRNDTLRIVKYLSKLEDTTLEMLGEFDQANEIIRRSAVSKLTSMESKLLGLDFHKTKQIMMANPDFDNHAKNILQHLSDHSAHMSLEAHLSSIVS